MGREVAEIAGLVRHGSSLVPIVEHRRDPLRRSLRLRIRARQQQATP
jgi:hypothetical protein